MENNKKMKRFKLLKDAPCAKAGAIFEEQGNFDDDKELVQVVPDGCLTRPWFAVSDIDNFDEWFEEIPEYKRWRGERGDVYYFLDGDGDVCHEIDTHDDVDNYRYNAGIYGRTKQELETKLEYNIARQVLLDDADGGRFTPGGSNYAGSYSFGTWDSTFVCNYFPGDIYFKSKDALKKSLEEHKEQWEIVRKYEMGEL
nr:MAG TPA: hypothetical protein [Caudoviricetes sp.]